MKFTTDAPAPPTREELQQRAARFARLSIAHGIAHAADIVLRDLPDWAKGIN